MITVFCICCHDPATRAVDIDKTYCKDCFEEIYKGKISNKSAHLHSSGHGCPLEPSDDAGPWQEFAIRCMEDGGDFF
jgi:hypothetical protein